VEILRSYTDQIGRETHISADDREETAITLVEVLGKKQEKYQLVFIIVVLKNFIVNVKEMSI
jgi:hypothetical protein